MVAFALSDCEPLASLTVDSLGIAFLTSRRNIAHGLKGNIEKMAINWATISIFIMHANEHEAPCWIAQFSFIARKRC